MSRDLSPSGIPINQWLTEPLSPLAARAIDRLRRLPDVVRIAVMPDVQPAESGCNGIALATTATIYPRAVGSDIGCGMTVARFEAQASWLATDARLSVLQRGLSELVPIVRHRSRQEARAGAASVELSGLSSASLVAAANRDGYIELGTLGRGNHFLELQRDDEDCTWALVHSGSRAMGQIITHAHLNGASGDALLDAASERGRAYINDACWAVRYAEANRDTILDTVGEILSTVFGIKEVTSARFGTSHNTLTREVFDDREYWIHRKGAAPASAGLRSVIPGSAGTESFHVTGRGNFEALRSSSHGAGRTASRTETARAHTRDSVREALRRAGVWSVTTPPDEAPAVYRDIRTVMRAQHELVSIDRRLRPFFSFRAR